MKLYNSLTKTTEDFKPLEEGKVKMYSCGPTVYNNLHIGNLSAFIYADMLRRSLEVQGYMVKHVMNITDVDDKTIRDSMKQYPDEDPVKSLKKFTDKYTTVFKNDLKATGNNLDHMTFISAVDSIADMVELIQAIIDNGFGYEAEDGIYFSISAYLKAGHSYGLLQKIDTSNSKSRVANDEYDKDSASDFALWKKSTDGEASWGAKFKIEGKELTMPGRPGWHIECSAMSKKLLGVPFDIHTGGIDLKFPHHENEIAQSCAAGAPSLCNYFVHNNHILVDGKKMSKSLGNVFTLRDIESRGFSGQDFRMLVLESLYHNESNFSWDILKAAQNRRSNWQAIIDTMHQLPHTDSKGVIESITTALSNNMDIPKSLRLIDSYFDECEKSKFAPNPEVISFIDKALGLEFYRDDISQNAKILLEKREAARTDNNWELSDDLRAELLEIGIRVKDHSTGQIWSRVQTD